MRKVPLQNIYLKNIIEIKRKGIASPEFQTDFRSLQLQKINISTQSEHILLYVKGFGLKKSQEQMPNQIAKNL